jgi:uncharacterized protein YjbI with pentapeptide repeats
MANQDQLNLIKAGVAGWNAWRNAHRPASIDLSGANLSGANLSWMSMREANLTGADMTDAYLYDTDMAFAIVRGANMRGVDLTRANLGGVLMVGILGDPFMGEVGMSRDVDIDMEMETDIPDVSGITEEQMQRLMRDMNLADPDPDSES